LYEKYEENGSKYMNSNNLNNIQSKLHVEERAAVEICNGAIEDDYQLTEKEIRWLKKIADRLAHWIDFEEMVSQLLMSKLYGDAFDHVDYTLNNEGRIYKVNIGLFNIDTGKVDTTSVMPNIFIDVVVDVAAQLMNQHPHKAERIKDGCLKLIKFVENNKMNV